VILQNFDGFSSTRKNSQTMGIKRPSDFILTLEENDMASESESDTESDNSVGNKNNQNKKRKVDQYLNSEFEFDGHGILGGVKGIDDDGWGFTGIPGMKESAGVDLEGIIARRRDKDCPTDNEEEEEETDGDEAEEFSGIEDHLGTAFIVNVLHFS
jgi:hypothetical protein